MAPATLLGTSPQATNQSAHEKITNKSRSLESALAEAESRYEANNPTSKQMHEQAARCLPGGNTRTLLHSHPFPICMRGGRGCQVTDEDGHTYTDFCGEMTAGLYGHQEEVINEAIKSTLDNVGVNLGANTASEGRYAALLCARFNLDRIRFTNSGTEANLHALAAARKYTGRRKVVVFTGGYHGTVLSFGSGSAPNNVDRDDFVLAKYNDIAHARETIEGLDDVAAVLVEPMQGSAGCIVGRKEFLHAVQAIAEKAGAVFILDEVMSSRLAPGGLQSVYGLSPDLTTFGKYLGGGLAFGAFGGSLDLMSVYDPRLAGSLAHSGTFNNNTLAMHAGYAGLSNVFNPEASIAFTAKGDRFRERLQQVSQGTKCSFTGLGSLLYLHFTDDGNAERIIDIDAVPERWDLKDLFWMEMLEEGFWITRRGSISLMLPTPQEELDRFVLATEAWLRRHANIVRATHHM